MRIIEPLLLGILGGLSIILLAVIYIYCSRAVVNLEIYILSRQRRRRNRIIANRVQHRIELIRRYRNDQQQEQEKEKLPPKNHIIVINPDNGLTIGSEYIYNTKEENSD